MANDNHNKIPIALLANAPIYIVLRRLDMVALIEKPKKIKIEDVSAIKIMFPDGSQFKMKEIKVEIAIPLNIEYAYDIYQ